MHSGRLPTWRGGMAHPGPLGSASGPEPTQKNVFFCGFLLYTAKCLEFENWSHFSNMNLSIAVLIIFLELFKGSMHCFTSSISMPPDFNRFQCICFLTSVLQLQSVFVCCCIRPIANDVTRWRHWWDIFNTCNCCGCRFGYLAVSVVLVQVL